MTEAPSPGTVFRRRRPSRSAAVVVQSDLERVVYLTTARGGEWAVRAMTTRQFFRTIQGVQGPEARAQRLSRS